MRSKIKKTWIYCCAIILILAMTACDDSVNNVKEDTQKSEDCTKEAESQPTETPAPEIPSPTPIPTPKVTSTPTPIITSEPTAIPESTATPTPQPSAEPETFLPKAIEYGDTITISYEKKEYNSEEWYVWNYEGSQEFKVSAESEQFHGASEEITMENVEQAIGKTAGDTFTIWFEEDDGLHGYEYTIVEVKGENADLIEYGDKIYTSFAMRGVGVDTGDGHTINTGEQVLRMTNTDAFMAMTEDGWSVDAADERIEELLGKGVGHSFDFIQSAYEWSHHYKYRIHGISKAVKYGDTIIAEVRKAVLVPDESSSVVNEEITFTLNENIEELNLSKLLEGRTVLGRLMGKNVGEEVEICLVEKDSYYADATIYNMEILAVKPGEKADEENAPIKALMLADEEEIVFISECSSNNGYQFPGMEQKIIYIIAEDAENHMIYEFYYDNSDERLFLEYVKGVEYEYDTEGRVAKEISKLDVGGGMEYSISEYKYDDDGNCVECIMSYPGEDGTFYIYCITSYHYNDKGICIEEKRDYNGEHEGLIEVIYYNDRNQIIKEVSTYSDGSKYISEYDSSKYHHYCKTTKYDAAGNVTVDEYEYEYEYDEWGFIIESY